MKRMSAVTLIALGFSAPAEADYYATGPIEGNVCRGFFIEACGLHKITAVKGDDGRLYAVQTRFASVTEYNEGTGRCWIRTKAEGGGLLSWAVNAAKQPVFYARTPDGEYRELDVDYVTFKCAKR